MTDGRYQRLVGVVGETTRHPTVPEPDYCEDCEQVTLCSSCGDGYPVADGGSTSDEETRVGHCKRDETDVYAGRGPGGRSMNDTEIGSRGWLGNPHRLDDGHSRAESIDLFRDDFEARLRADDEFREAVRGLSGAVLGCWCQSLEDDGPACHAEVIAEHADRL